MILALVLLTVAVFLFIEFLMTREDKAVSVYESMSRASIFMNPEKSLVKIPIDANRRFHPSHTWYQMSTDNDAVVGFDEMIPFLFAENIGLEKLPVLYQTIHQGDTLWQIRANNKLLTQKSPISGSIAEINPACSGSIPLPADLLSTSWIIKIKPERLGHEAGNLLPYSAAAELIHFQKEQLVSQLHGEHLFNDGGRLDPGLIRKLDDTEWKNITSIIGLPDETQKN